MRFLRTFVIGLLLLGFATVAVAEVPKVAEEAKVVEIPKIKLPAIIGSNMVLQRGEKVPVWGWSEPGTKVEVQFDGKTAMATTGKDGRWQVMLGPLSVGKPRTMVITTDKGDKVQLDNILVGEVWLCSGQSNMGYHMLRCHNPEEEIPKAKYPNLRLFKVALVPSEKPLDDCKGTWAECTPEVVQYFSGVGYYFGRKLHKDLDVPVGMIQSAWGGTVCEAWTPEGDLTSSEITKPLVDWRNEYVKKHPEKAVDRNHASHLYNGMIHPLIPYGIRGAIWYQGEGNRSRAVQYETLLPMMINSWRRLWNKSDMPFGVVQLAPYRYVTRLDPYRNDGTEVMLCELWEAQLKTMQNTPNVGMAVTTDVTTLLDIHPPKKEPVGDRLALWAEAKVYGKDLVYSGPIYKSMKIEGDKIRLSFDHVGGGLKCSDENGLSWFTIAGEDQKFVPAAAEIEGDTIVVWTPRGVVKKPVAVRFGWHESATPNLINAEGLPASPFRTDNFKSFTEGNLSR